MNVVGHNDGNVQVIADAIALQATVEGDCPGGGWKKPAMTGNERDEMRFVIALEMWKILAVERHALNRDRQRDESL